MGVEFNEEDRIARTYATEPTPPIAKWLISKRLAKDLPSANKLQIFAALVFFALAIYFAV